ncbi:hypothetical protein F5Y16DRAFT_403463 [Xylariaceae sp. FL0255]|nr:hypothetical protein F5Y16DRAFT_403463 [Xylariaceae sp. FL0255]
MNIDSPPAQNLEQVDHFSATSSDIPYTMSSTNATHPTSAQTAGAIGTLGGDLMAMLLKQTYDGPGQGIMLPRVALERDLTLGTDEINLDQDGSVDEKLQTVYRVFYKEWNSTIGPAASEQLAPPLKLNDKNYEAMAFVTLFPFGYGHYLPDDADPDFTFEKYVVSRLNMYPGRFQNHQGWLQWVLTQTDSKELAALVNLVLLGVHGFKAKHLGEGRLQESKPGEGFEDCS